MNFTERKREKRKGNAKGFCTGRQMGEVLFIEMLAIDDSSFVWCNLEFDKEGNLSREKELYVFPSTCHSCMFSSFLILSFVLSVFDKDNLVTQSFIFFTSWNITNNLKRQAVLIEGQTGAGGKNY